MSRWKREEAMNINRVPVRFGLAPLAFVVLVAAVVAQASVTVNGTVRGRQGDPKQFASVSLEGPRRYLATTDANGTFRIDSVASGTYTVRVRQGDRVDEFFNRHTGNGPLDLIVKW